MDLSGIQIALGGTSIVIRKSEPESLLKTIEREKATIVSGSPALYNMLLQHPRAQLYETRSVTKCTSGSDKLPMEIKKNLASYKKPTAVAFVPAIPRNPSGKALKRLLRGEV